MTPTTLDVVFKILCLLVALAAIVYSAERERQDRRTYAKLARAYERAAAEARGLRAACEGLRRELGAADAQREAAEAIAARLTAARPPAPVVPLPAVPQMRRPPGSGVEVTQVGVLAPEGDPARGLAPPFNRAETQP